MVYPPVISCGKLAWEQGVGCNLLEPVIVNACSDFKIRVQQRNFPLSEGLVELS